MFSNQQSQQAKSLESLNSIYSRIQSIDQRINSLKGESISPNSISNTDTKLDNLEFSQVLGQIRNNLPARANQWIVEDAIKQASTKTGVDADLIKAVIQVESGGNSNAVSGAGAKGLMQLIDSTANSLGVNNSFDPHENALGGANYLKQQLNKFGGNLHLALAAYNAGPQAVVKYNGIPPYTETIDYVKKVSGAYQSLKKFEFEKN
jgi:soluble lytic murein transglycosylase-like protein